MVDLNALNVEVATDRPVDQAGAREDPKGERTPRGQTGTRRSSAADYRALAEFRFLIRRFLASSEEMVRTKGITPQQHQLMLAIEGRAPGDEPTIRYLAERLRIKHHSAVGLVDRLSGQGLVERAHVSSDRRQVYVRLTARGAEVLEALSTGHRQELRTLAPRLVEALQSVVSST